LRLILIIETKLRMEHRKRKRYKQAIHANTLTRRLTKALDWWRKQPVVSVVLRK